MMQNVFMMFQDAAPVVLPQLGRGAAPLSSTDQGNRFAQLLQVKVPTGDGSAGNGFAAGSSATEPVTAALLGMTKDSALAAFLADGSVALTTEAPVQQTALPVPGEQKLPGLELKGATPLQLLKRQLFIGSTPVGKGEILPASFGTANAPQVEMPPAAETPVLSDPAPAGKGEKVVSGKTPEEGSAPVTIPAAVLAARTTLPPAAFQTALGAVQPAPQPLATQAPAPADDTVAQAAPEIRPAQAAAVPGKTTAETVLAVETPAGSTGKPEPAPQKAAAPQQPSAEPVDTRSTATAPQAPQQAFAAPQPSAEPVDARSTASAPQAPQRPSSSDAAAAVGRGIPTHDARPVVEQTVKQQLPEEAAAQPTVVKQSVETMVAPRAAGQAMPAPREEAVPVAVRKDATVPADGAKVEAALDKKPFLAVPQVSVSALKEVPTGNQTAPIRNVVAGAGDVAAAESVEAVAPQQEARTEAILPRGEAAGAPVAEPAMPREPEVMVATEAPAPKAEALPKAEAPVEKTAAAANGPKESPVHKEAATTGEKRAARMVRELYGATTMQVARSEEPHRETDAGTVASAGKVNEPAPQQPETPSLAASKTASQTQAPVAAAAKAPEAAAEPQVEAAATPEQAPEKVAVREAKPQHAAALQRGELKTEQTREEAPVLKVETGGAEAAPAAANPKGGSFGGEAGKKEEHEQKTQEKAAPQVHPLGNGIQAAAPAEVQVSEAKPATPKSALHESILSQIKDGAVTHDLKGNSQISIRLNPGELGELKIQVRMEDNRLRVEVQADNKMVKDLLMNNLDTLKETLAGKNLTMDGFNVSTGSREGFQSAMADDRGNFSQRQPGRAPRLASYSEGGEPARVNYLTGDVNNLLDVRF